MLSRKAVDDYLNKELDDWDWIKSKSREEIISLLNDNYSGWDCGLLKPFKHQLDMILLGLSLGNFLYFADMGLGKTYVIQSIVQTLKQRGTVRKALVCVPNEANIRGWEEEAKLYMPNLNVMPLYGSSSERFELLKQDADLYILNYQGLVAMSTVKAKKKKGLGNERVIVPQIVKAFCDFFDMVVFDESQNLRSWKSLSYKICSRLGNSCRYKFAMTGTPMGRDPHHLWPQFFSIDGGETLGGTLGIFRAAFFDEKLNRWGAREYKLLKGSKEKIYQRIKNKSIRYRDKDCRDVPKRLPDTKVWIDLSEENKKYYNKLLQDIKRAEGHYQLIKSTFMLMRQICSGFITLKSDVDKQIVDLANNPKLEALIDLISTVPEDRKVVVFHEFTHSAHLIEEEFIRNKINFVSLRAEIKDKGGAVEKFKKDKNCRVLLANSRSGGTGLNLQVANYVIFYESSVDPVTRQQAEKRCDRTGQKYPVHFYDIVTKGTIEETILLYLKQGKNLLKHIVDGTANV
jgi:SNF2 family DNA or RNA helicase